MSGQDFIYGVFKRSDVALHVVADLHGAGLTKSDICVLGSGEGEFKYVSAQLKDPTVKYFVMSGLIGCVLGLFAGVMGAPRIHYDMPMFQILTPLMGAISGGIVLAYFGMFMGAFLNANQPQHWANVFEGTVQDGEVIVAVEPTNNEQRKLAMEIIDRSHPVELIVRKKSINDIVPKEEFIPTIAADRPVIAEAKPAEQKTPASKVA